MRWLIVYIAVGLVAGVLAARYEYRHGASPEDVASAGSVGLFAACFWPVVGLVYLLGLIAKATRP